ncbi:MAG: hypothetical protein ACREOI_00450 [bacterium]
MRNVIESYLSYMKTAGIGMLFAAILFSLYAGIKSSAFALEIVSATFAALVAFVALFALVALIRSSNLSHTLTVFVIRLLEGFVVALKKRLRT